MLRIAENVQCHTFSGSFKSVPKHKLRFRPSVYAVIIHNSQLLLVENRLAYKDALPGGSIELGETTYETLKREVREEIGVEVEVERFLHFEQIFFYFDPLDEAYHGLLFYYLCSPTTREFAEGWRMNDLEGNPKWISIADLSSDNLFNGETIMKLLQSLQEEESNTTP